MNLNNSQKSIPTQAMPPPPTQFSPANGQHIGDVRSLNNNTPLNNNLMYSRLTNGPPPQAGIQQPFSGAMAPLQAGGFHQQANDPQTLPAPHMPTPISGANALTSGAMQSVNQMAPNTQHQQMHGSLSKPQGPTVKKTLHF